MKTALILISSFFGSIGDTVFLFGVPMYLFQTFNSSFFASSLISLAITITVLVARKYIVDINQNNPVLLTAIGESAMGLVELALLAFYSFVSPSPWTIIIGTIPLALIYNSYAASKFLRVQEHVFPNRVLFYSALQSGLVRVGSLLGVSIAGWLLLKYGLRSILLLDSMSFLISGLVLSLFIKNGSHRVTKNVEHSDDHSNVSANNPVISVNEQSTHQYLVLVFLSLVFLAWEQASALATISVISGKSLSECSIFRGIFGAVGVVASIALIHFRPQWMMKSWVLALTILVTFGGIFSFVSPLFAAGILLFFGSFIGSIQTPVQRYIYSNAETLSLYSKPLPAQQMTLSSGLTITLPVLGLFLDRAMLGQAWILPVTFGFIIFIGIFGGYLLKKSFI